MSFTNRETVVIPFGFTYYPLTKLALINFEKSPDDYYIGLEPQYIDDETIGKGYRVIAYRCDGYVDVYDEVSLNENNDTSFDVTGKGLCERVRVEMENTTFEKTNGCFNLSFQFTDKYKRDIFVHISEQSTKATNGLHLLAPIGSSTEKPSYLPIFFLYNFDFVRKNQTDVQVRIDGKQMKIDDFPFPLAKDFQWRYFTRYSDDCQIIEFASAGTGSLVEYQLDGRGNVVREEIEYQFSAEKKLKKMELKRGAHPFNVEFEQGFPDIRTMTDHSLYEDTFVIRAEQAIGSISGHYSVKREEDVVKIELVPSGGWTAVPNSFFTKIMFSKKSVFCSWPKRYRYLQTIHLSTLETSSRWEKS